MCNLVLVYIITIIILAICTPPGCKKIDSSESKRDVTQDDYSHQNEGKMHNLILAFIVKDGSP